MYDSDPAIKMPVYLDKYLPEYRTAYAYLEQRDDEGELQNASLLVKEPGCGLWWVAHNDREAFPHFGTGKTSLVFSGNWVRLGEYMSPYIVVGIINSLKGECQDG